MKDHTVYRSVGGDLIAQGVGWLEPADVESLAALHQDEITAAHEAGDLPALGRARRLAEQLAQAQAASARWRMAGRGLDAARRSHSQSR